MSHSDVASLVQLLKETATRHGSFEAVAPPHDWWDWYAAYMDARERGSTPEEASEAAGRYMAEVKGVVFAPRDIRPPLAPRSLRRRPEPPHERVVRPLHQRRGRHNVLVDSPSSIRHRDGPRLITPSKCS